jgi:thiol-disulfide isomerase/thioredoxin
VAISAVRRASPAAVFLIACVAAIPASAAGIRAAADATAIARLSPARQDFYRQALPQARRFIARRIAAARLPPADSNNDSYVEARDATGKKVGYLRDFIGPVSPNQACPCNPLNLTLVFDAGAKFKTLLAPAPLQKWGHEAMSEQEFARLIELCGALPAPLCQVPTVEDMVDATTGATRQALAPVVVAHAALSTRRIVGLVADTQAILQGDPVDARTTELHSLLSAPLQPLQRAKKLAELIGRMQAQGLRLQAYHLMVQNYLRALPSGAADAQVEAAILGFGVLCEGGGMEVADACLRIAETGRRKDFVQACSAQLAGAEARGIAPLTAELLTGTAEYMAGNLVAARPLLRRAAQSRPAQHHPQLYLRLARAEAAGGDPAASCQAAKMLLEHHPLIPGGSEALQICVQQGQSLKELQAELDSAAQRRLSQAEVSVHGAPAALSLLTPAGRPVTVPLASPHQATVLVFFATWCPHCQAELPHLRRFINAIKQSDTLREKVRVVAVRTAQAKETPAARKFWRSFAADFETYADADMSQAFAAFARATGRPTMLPTTAVLDGQGTVRFFIEPGLYRDIQSELIWASTLALQPEASVQAPDQARESRAAPSASPPQGA